MNTYKFFRQVHPGCFFYNKLYSFYLVNFLNRIRVVISRTTKRHPLRKKGGFARPSCAYMVLIFLLCAVSLIHFRADFSYSATSLNSFSQDNFTDRSIDGIISVFFNTDPVHILFVEKDRQVLSVLEYDNGLRVVAQYSCATGENPGRKQVVGDSRTPTGIYFILKIYKDNKITIFGKRAFHLDYPNAFDMAESRNGNGIYIHGTNKPLTPKSTNGCITLRNHDLDELVEFLQLDVTPVIIVESRDFFVKGLCKQFPDHDFELLTRLIMPKGIDPGPDEFEYLFLLNNGAQTVAVGEFFQQKDDVSGILGYTRSYLELLPDEIWTERDRIWKTSPIQIVTASIGSGLKKSLPLFKEPSVSASSSSKQSKKSAEIFGQGLDKSAIELKNKGTSTDKLHQYASRNQAETTSSAVEKPEPAPPAPPYPKKRRMVVDFVKKWRNAWQSKEIDTYMICYHETFFAGNRNRSEWRRHKEKLAGKYKFIKVEISGIKVSWTQNGAEVSFRQAYRSDMYSADGRKVLRLKFSKQGWLITRELWEPKKKG